MIYVSWRELLHTFLGCDSGSKIFELNSSMRSSISRKILSILTLLLCSFELMWAKYSLYTQLQIPQNVCFCDGWIESRGITSILSSSRLKLKLSLSMWRVHLAFSTAKSLSVLSIYLWVWKIDTPRGIFRSARNVGTRSSCSIGPRRSSSLSIASWDTTFLFSNS